MSFLALHVFKNDMKHINFTTALDGSQGAFAASLSKQQHKIGTLLGRNWERCAIDPRFPMG